MQKKCNQPFPQYFSPFLTKDLGVPWFMEDVKRLENPLEVYANFLLIC